MAFLNFVSLILFVKSFLCVLWSVFLSFNAILLVCFSEPVSGDRLLSSWSWKANTCEETLANVPLL